MTRRRQRKFIARKKCENNQPTLHHRKTASTLCNRFKFRCSGYSACTMREKDCSRKSDCCCSKITTFTENLVSVERTKAESLPTTGTVRSLSLDLPSLSVSERRCTSSRVHKTVKCFYAFLCSIEALQRKLLTKDQMLELSSV